MNADSLTITVPIRTDADGTMRIANTRLILDLVLSAWLNGESPEGIVQMYDVLTVRDVYAIIAYYLDNREQLDEYLRVRRVEAAHLYEEWQSRLTPEHHAFFGRLRALKEQKQASG